jgi:hypothetical protein
MEAAHFDLAGRLCGLVVRVPGYRSRGLGFDSRSAWYRTRDLYNLILEEVSLEWVICELQKSNKFGYQWKPRITTIDMTIYIENHQLYALRLRKWKQHVTLKLRKHCPQPHGVGFQQFNINSYLPRLTKALTTVDELHDGYMSRYVSCL